MYTTQDQFEVYEAFGNYATDHLFWSLVYLNAALFHCPNREAVRRKLLLLPEQHERLITYFYNTAEGVSVASAMQRASRAFIRYIDALADGKPGGCADCEAQWREAIDTIAANLALLNPDWRRDIWKTMLTQEYDMLLRIAKATQAGKYEAFPQDTPLCARLARDMSQYLASGIVKQKMQ